MIQIFLCVRQVLLLVVVCPSKQSLVQEADWLLFRVFFNAAGQFLCFKKTE
jgi:hypothetical protein